MRFFKFFAQIAFFCGAVALAGCNGSSNRTATQPMITSVALTPLAVALAPGGTQAMTVTATESSGATLPVTQGVTYASSNINVATVNAAGLVTAGSGAGTANITATVTIAVNTVLVSPAAVVTVTLPAPTLVSIALTPAATTLATGATQQLTVTGTYSDNSKAVLTTAQTFVSSNTAIAAVTAGGLVTAGATAGTATITATDTPSGKTGTATITVPMPAPTLVSIALTPAATTLVKGTTQQLTVTGTYSDNSKAVLTTAQTFASSNTAIATVTVGGLVTAGATAGTATITATDTPSGKTGTATITVPMAAPTLVSIALSPLSASVAPKATQQLTVTGTYSDNSTKTLAAGGETFQSMSTGVATVDATGLVTVAAGATVGQSATITAKDTASGLSTSAQTSALITVKAASTGAGNVYSNGALDPGVVFAPFGGSVNSPLPAPDTSTPFTDNTAALKVVITGAAGAYSGGAFVASSPRDLRAFNAMSFWAKGSKSQSTLKVQFGNDAGAGANVDFQVESIGLPLTTNWQQYVIPMPDPTRANGLDGMWSFADANNGYTFWLANVRYLNVPANVLGTGMVAGDGFQQVPLTGNPAAYTIAQGGNYLISPASNSIIWTLGSAQLNGSPVVPLANGGNLDNDAWRWFAMSSSNANATVNSDGLVTAVSAGNATVSATLAATAIPGSVPFRITAPLAAPSNNAATPTPLPANVIALFDSSAVYPPVPVDNFNTNWCNAGTTQTPFTPAGGKAVMQYALNNCTGIVFGDTTATSAHTINASAAGMTRFHMDVWSPNPVDLKLQIIDNAAGPGAAIIGAYDAGIVAANTWVSIDQPFTAFAGLTVQDKLQQIGLFPTAPPGMTLYVDNLYFYKSTVVAATVPAANAPAPAQTGAIALYSSSAVSPTWAYTLQATDYWPNPNFCNGSAPLGTAGRVTLSNQSKVYGYAFGAAYPNSCSAVTFGDGEAGGSTVNTLNATGKTRFHMDVWSSSPVPLSIQLANAANTAAGCGTAPESCGVYTASAIPASQWYSIDVALPSAFSGAPSTGTGKLTGINALQQLILSTTTAATFYIDNIYVY